MKHSPAILFVCAILFLSLIIQIHDFSPFGRFTNSILASFPPARYAYIWFPELILMGGCINLYRKEGGRFWLALLCFSFLFTCSYTLTLYSQYLYIPHLQYGYALLGLPAVYVSARTPKNRKLFLWFLAGVAMYEGLFGIGQTISWSYFGREFPAWLGWLKPLKFFYLHDGSQYHQEIIRVTGTLNDPNNYGVFLVLCGGASVPLYLSIHSRWKTIVLACIHTLTGLGIYYSFSKSAWIASGIFILLASAQFWKKINRTVVFMVIAGAALFCALEYEHVSKRISSFDTESASNSARIVALQTSMAMLKDHPFFGIGVGRFYEYFDQYRPADYEESRFFSMNSHLQLLVETGMVGFLFYAVLIFAVFYSCIRSYLAGNQEAFLFAAILLAVCINGIFSHMLIIFPMSLYFWSLLGLIYARCYHPDSV